MSKKVMVADDDPSIVEVMKIILEMSGYEVITTTDGAELDHLDGSLPDLLLLDIWMSGLDGRIICQKLKSEEKTKHLPIVLVSAGRDLDKSAQNAGADNYLAKPFEMDDLLDMVKKYAY